MALFKSKDTNLQKNANHAPKKAIAKDVISSIISQEMVITGEISFSGKARIDGTLEGNLTGEYLILSEVGKIKGDLQLESLVCHGQIEGNIYAKVVTIHATAAIKGKLIADSLTVEPGALLSGEISAADKGKPISESEKQLPQTKAVTAESKNKK
jgi:cytoskeletal protein CcmA (bactofilin family)